MAVMDYRSELVNAFNMAAVRSDKRDLVMGLLDDLRAYHPPTFEHSVKVGLTSYRIAEFGRLDPKMGLYGSLHDVGKSKVPREVLDKTLDFTLEDMQAMRTHTAEGFRMLHERGFKFAAWVALMHHRFQPSPYPSDDELPEFPIPGASTDTRLLADECARIVSIADTYDATSTRCNSRFGGRTPSRQEVKDIMIANNPGRKTLIEGLYKEGIFTL